MEAVLNPKKSAKIIAENSKDVYIEDNGVQKVAEMLLERVTEKEFSLTGWKSSHELNPQPANEDTVNWVFVTDVLNFSFWAEHEDRKCLVQYKGKTYSGYWSLCAAINRALDEGIPITSASYYTSMTLDQVKYAFRSDTEVPMPLIEERHRVLNEAGTILLEKFGGSFLTCVKESGKSAQKLLQIIVQNFPSFRDEATFQGRKVAFYKRAQILVADTWSVLEGKGDGCFSDISRMTVFADYRIPQVLVHLGAMRYSEELMNKLKKEEDIIPKGASMQSWDSSGFVALQDGLVLGHMFRFGDNQEVEIRGCTIWCCELICSCLLDLYKQKGENMSEKINAVLLDYYLWDYAQKHRDDMKGVSFHRVRSIYY